MKIKIKELQNRIEVMSKEIYKNYFVNEKLVEENEALLKENNELKKIIEMHSKFAQIPSKRLNISKYITKYEGGINEIYEEPL